MDDGVVQDVMLEDNRQQAVDVCITFVGRLIVTCSSHPRPSYQSLGLIQ